MDAKAKKAFFWAKLNAQKKEKRINSPLVRYNDYDQPVCRVCEVVLKSESLWDAHQVSRALSEVSQADVVDRCRVNAISNIKASAAGKTHVDTAKAEPPREVLKPKHKQTIESHNSKKDHSASLPEPNSSSGLPSDFFDSHGTKRKRSGSRAATLMDRNQPKNPESSKTQMIEYDDSDDEVDRSSNATAIRKNEAQPGRAFIQSSTQATVSETKTQKGALPGDFFDSKESNLPVPGSKTISSETNQPNVGIPEGFFDNKDADLRARGIKPVKIDVNDEYKEFEKLIHEDLKDVDDRMEEEEIDAAEMVLEAETWEQKAYRERLEMLKRKKSEMAAKSTKRSRVWKVDAKESGEEDSSSDDDCDGNFAVDWRAQHL